MLLFLAFGVPGDRIAELAQIVIPAMQNFGINHERSTFVSMPMPYTFDEAGNRVDSAPAVLVVPAFAELRRSGVLESLLADLSLQTGMICCSSNAPVVAAIGGQVL